MLVNFRLNGPAAVHPIIHCEIDFHLIYLCVPSCPLWLTGFMDWQNWRTHLRTTGSALKNWFIAQCYDSLAVAALWLVGLLIIGIPWAPLWAILGGVLQLIPNFGVMISLIGPALLGAL